MNLRYNISAHDLQMRDKRKRSEMKSYFVKLNLWYGVT